MKIDKDVLKILNESEENIDNFEQFKASIKDLLNSIGINVAKLEMNGLIKYNEQDNIVGLVTNGFYQRASISTGNNNKLWTKEELNGLCLRYIDNSYMLLDNQHVDLNRLSNSDFNTWNSQVEVFQGLDQLEQLKFRLIELIKEKQQVLRVKYPDAFTKQSRNGLVTYFEITDWRYRGSYRVPKWLIDFK